MILGLLGACTSAPPEMVIIPAGSFEMGDTRGHLDAQPVHRVHLSEFVLDTTLVSHEKFSSFVSNTGHITDAEKLGFGMVSREGMGDWDWEKVTDATWRQPWGPHGHRQGPQEPVVMVSHQDATAYCEWVGKRLPTEAEWEYAMRAGARTRFPWGEQPNPDGQYRLNFWQGADHTQNTREDGHLYTSPIRHYPPNKWGVYDAVGNVWQFTSDWYGADTYQRGEVTDPHGPETGWARVGRGGSWWCSQNACSAYGLFARGKARPEAPYANNGFRCAKTRSRHSKTAG